jgi:hypothetical protein
LKACFDEEDLMSQAFPLSIQGLPERWKRRRGACVVLRSFWSAVTVSSLLTRSAHHVLGNGTQMELKPSDFHVAVKRREYAATPWRWEIWAAGKTKAVAQSERHFATMSEAMRQGKEALKAALSR